jgi:hypothetical protein
MQIEKTIKFLQALRKSNGLIKAAELEKIVGS